MSPLESQPPMLERSSSNLSSSSSTKSSISNKSSSSNIRRSNSSNNNRSNRNKGRSVRFDEGRNQVLVFEHEIPFVHEEVWFSADEYVIMKAKSREEARHWRRQGYGVLMRETFDMPSPATQDHLNAFCQMEGNMCRRGLERHLNRQHGEQRSDLKDRARQCVLIHQRRLQRQGMDLVDVMERCAEIYTQSCRPAKIFARRLGRADEYTVLYGEDNRPAERILDRDAATSGSRPGGKMERRMSNFSVKSGNSFDSKRQWGMTMINHNNNNSNNRDPNSNSNISSLHYHGGGGGPMQATAAGIKALSANVSHSSSHHHHHPYHAPNHHPTTGSAGMCSSGSLNSSGGGGGSKAHSRCSSSPASPVDEYYAAIA